MTRSPKSNVRRLALGRLISVTGGAAAYTALNYTVWERTHSPYMQALSLLLTFGVAGIDRSLHGRAGRPVQPPDRDDLVGGDLGRLLRRDGLREGPRRPDRPRVRICDRRASVLLGVACGDPEPRRVGGATSRGRTAWSSMGVHAGIAVGPVIGGASPRCCSPPAIRRRPTGCTWPRPSSSG